MDSTKNYYIATFLFIIGGLILALSLFPSGTDVAWMYYYDRQYDRSSKQFQEIFQAREQTRSVIVPKIWLDLTFANDDEAVQTVEEYIKKNPEAVDARLFLGELYKRAGRTFNYLHNLEEIYAREPSLEALKELNRLYQETNDLESQIGALQTLVDKDAATIEDLLQLTHLYASQKQMTKALQIINHITERFNLKHLGEESVVLMIEILLDNDQKEKAFLLANNYLDSIKGDKKLQLDAVFSLAYFFLEHNLQPQAEFISHYIPKKEDKKNRVLELRLAIKLHNQNEHETFKILAREFKKGTLTPTFYTELLSLSLEYEQIELSRSILQILDFTKVPKSGLPPLLGKMIALQEKEMIELLEENLGEKTISANPLLRIGFLLPKRGEKEINEIIAQNDLSEIEQISLAEYLYDSGFSKEAKELCSKIKSLDDVSVSDLPKVTLLFINLELTEKIASLLNELTLPPGVDKGTYVKAQLFVLAAQGNASEVKKRLELLEVEDSGFYADLFYLAEKVKQNALALFVAEKLLKQFLNQSNQLLYVRGLTLNGDYKKALKILDKLKQENVDVEEAYLTTLTFAAEKDPLLKDELHEAASEIRQKTLSKKKKREYASLFLEHKFSNLAESFYLELAEGQLYDSSDVQSLLYIWGEKLEEEQANWIVEQGKGKNGKELAGWIKHLLYNGHEQKAALLAKQSDWTSEYISDLYLESLQATNQREEIQEALATLVPTEENVPRLKKFGQIGKDLSIYPTAEEAYRKVLTKEPNDSETLKHMGILQFVQGKFFDAKYYLSEYLDTPDPDYLGYYYYGDIFWVYGHKMIAKQYFLTAIWLMQKNIPEDPFMRAVEAQIYFRLGCYGKALSIYDEIIRENPKKASFPIDLANLLIDLECYCRAARILFAEDRVTDDKESPHEKKNLDLNFRISQVRLFKEIRWLKVACRLTNHLLQSYPDNPRVLALKADLENTLGRWYSSVRYLDEAVALEPKNELYRRLRREVYCEHQSELFTQYEDKLTGRNQQESKYSAFIYHRLNPIYALQVQVDTDDMLLTRALRIFTVDDIVEFDDARVRGEVSLDCRWDDGIKAILSAYFSRDKFGYGLFFGGQDYLGEGHLVVKYNFASWDFVESIINFGTEDRIEIYRSLLLGPRVTIFGGGGFRWYNLLDLERVSSTYVFQTGMIYRVPKSFIFSRMLGYDGFWFLNYTIDAQYVTKLEKFTSPLGNEVPIFPIQDRETHVLSLSMTKQFSPCLNFQGFGGVTWDRNSTGDAAPTYGFVLDYGHKCGIRAKFEFFHTASTEFENETTDRYIFDIYIPY